MKLAEAQYYFSSIFKWIYDNVIKPFTEAFWKAFDWLMVYVITPICSFAQKKFEEMLAFITPIIDGLTKWFEDSSTNICSAITLIKETFVGIWDDITAKAQIFFEWVSGKLGGVSDLVSGFGTFLSNGINNSAAGMNAQAAQYEDKTVGLSTGGYVKTSGIAMLHPDEVVVNDDLTRGLGTFLNDYKTGNSAMNAIASRSSASGNVTNSDSSVTFLNGSVLIQIANATDAELERAADILMEKIARKQELKNMAVRK